MINYPCRGRNRIHAKGFQVALRSTMRFNDDPDSDPDTDSEKDPLMVAEPLRVEGQRQWFWPGMISGGGEICVSF